MSISELRGNSPPLVYYDIYRIIAETQQLMGLMPQVIAAFQVASHSLRQNHEHHYILISLPKSVIGKGEGKETPRSETRQPLPIHILLPNVLRAQGINSGTQDLLNPTPRALLPLIFKGPLSVKLPISQLNILNPISLRSIKTDPDTQAKTPIAPTLIKTPQTPFAKPVLEVLVHSVKEAQKAPVLEIDKKAKMPQPETVKPVGNITLNPEVRSESIEPELASSFKGEVQPTPTIHHHGELSALLQPQSNQQSLALPLTFIVPYPFEQAITATPTASSQKNSTHQKPKNRGQGGEKESQMMVLVLAGPLLHGQECVEVPSFAIGAVPVTNGQFAHWLNEYFDSEQIQLNDGEIRDREGKLICVTKEKDPTSQIQMTFREGALTFKPIRLTDHHPVVNATYYGASLFCKSNGFRLPTEWEWERAAAMAPVLPGQPLKKFKYGCSSDEMDLLKANYRENFGAMKPLENLTTPVGFYNGESLFAKHYQTLRTQIAVSPFGCYDMSGNVREWVAEHIAKGGSYDCPMSALEVEARAVIPHTHDHKTGFRVALTIN